ncbi:MAG: Probable low-affinity inorganic phosphate transporter [uncultured Gemmatimonadetes bacterium]|uniref:Probable low-affinity inorganic phosphate transporter n=1 Tax=uncultured Gemmatimonadota bacterium TaxID=203437 RepID=A0A6J4MSE6_9BACT|nr:MAG: Probable low-affinity inorganic phosphate transporter [uncultured Gemmatimonadota bacterium]
MTSVDANVLYILVIIGVAFAFDFINGFHDSANSIATVVGTRVLSPVKAVFWAAFFNFAALFVVGTAVAKTLGKGMIDVNIVTPSVVMGGLLGAIIWNLITWYYGIPSSSSHALLGGYAGAAVAKAGFGAIIPGGWVKTILFIFLSPLIGMALGWLLMLIVLWVFHKSNSSAGFADRFFRVAQLASSAVFSLSHGGNDAQKTMGIIVGLLVSSNAAFAGQQGWMRHLYLPNADHVPLWVELLAYTMISLGTLFGGWRIVHTMGTRITRLRPVGGFAAETGGAMSIFIATYFGIPVSTTHTITGAIVGVGATRRLSAVRWNIAGRIVWAWFLTIPAAFGISALCYLLLRVTIAP